jgi:hypothetical protein
MKSFNPSLLTHSFEQLTIYEREASFEKLPDASVADQTKADVALTLTTANLVATAVNLVETKDAISRLDMDLRSTAEKMTAGSLQYSLHHLLELMQSELQKRKVFVIDSEKSKFYQNDIYGIKPPTADVMRSFVDWPVPQPQFGVRVVEAFPSAYMDIVEAGRCLALNRNNAAVYHLMQVAEVGLRVLAWDRRVEVKRKKGQVIPLDFAQWGEMIRGLEDKKKDINHWKRSKHLKEGAVRYYTHAIFEVDSFNEIFRKHISHSRNKLYEPDVAASCWGHVQRFMDTLAERMSEDYRTPLVWTSKQMAT